MDSCVIDPRKMEKYFERVIQSNPKRYSNFDNIAIEVIRGNKNDEYQKGTILYSFARLFKGIHDVAPDRFILGKIDEFFKHDKLFSDNPTEYFNIVNKVYRVNVTNTNYTSVFSSIEDLTKSERVLTGEDIQDITDKIKAHLNNHVYKSAEEERKVVEDMFGILNTKINSQANGGFLKNLIEENTKKILDKSEYIDINSLKDTSLEILNTYIVTIMNKGVREAIKKDNEYYDFYTGEKIEQYTHVRPAMVVPEYDSNNGKVVFYDPNLRSGLFLSDKVSRTTGKSIYEMFSAYDGDLDSKYIIYAMRSNGIGKARMVRMRQTAIDNPSLAALQNRTMETSENSTQINTLKHIGEEVMTVSRPEEDDDFILMGQDIETGRLFNIYGLHNYAFVNSNNETEKVDFTNPDHLKRIQKTAVKHTTRNSKGINDELTQEDLSNLQRGYIQYANLKKDIDTFIQGNSNHQIDVSDIFKQHFQMSSVAPSSTEVQSLLDYVNDNPTYYPEFDIVHVNPNTKVELRYKKRLPLVVYDGTRKDNSDRGEPVMLSINDFNIDESNWKFENISLEDGESIEFQGKKYDITQRKDFIEDYFKPEQIVKFFNGLNTKDRKNLQYLVATSPTGEVTGVNIEKRFSSTLYNTRFITYMHKLKELILAIDDVNSKNKTYDEKIIEANNIVRTFNRTVLSYDFIQSYDRKSHYGLNHLVDITPEGIISLKFQISAKNASMEEKKEYFNTEGRPDAISIETNGKNYSDPDVLLNYIDGFTHVSQGLMPTVKRLLISYPQLNEYFVKDEFANIGSIKEFFYDIQKLHDENPTDADLKTYQEYVDRKVSFLTYFFQANVENYIHERGLRTFYINDVLLNDITSNMISFLNNKENITSEEQDMFINQVSTNITNILEGNKMENRLKEMESTGAKDMKDRVLGFDLYNDVLNIIRDAGKDIDSELVLKLVDRISLLMVDSVDENTSTVTGDNKYTKLLKSSINRTKEGKPVSYHPSKYFAEYTDRIINGKMQRTWMMKFKHLADTLAKQEDDKTVASEDNFRDPKFYSIVRSKGSMVFFAPADRSKSNTPIISTSVTETKDIEPEVVKPVTPAKRPAKFNRDTDIVESIDEDFDNDFQEKYNSDRLLSEKQWVEENLGEVLVSEYGDKMRDSLDTDGTVLGFYKDQAIYIDSVKATVGTIFHEAFHHVFRSFISPGQQQVLLNTVKNDSANKGKFTAEYIKDFAERRNLDESVDNIKDLIAEEILADGFKKYMNRKTESKNTSLIHKFFRWLANAIKSLVIKKTEIENLYDRIDTGYYKNATVINSIQPGKIAYELVPTRQRVKRIKDSEEVIFMHEDLSNHEYIQLKYRLTKRILDDTASQIAIAKRDITKIRSIFDNHRRQLALSLYDMESRLQEYKQEERFTKDGVFDTVKWEKFKKEFKNKYRVSMDDAKAILGHGMDDLNGEPIHNTIYAENTTGNVEHSGYLNYDGEDKELDASYQKGVETLFKDVLNVIDVLNGITRKELNLDKEEGKEVDTNEENDLFDTSEDETGNKFDDGNFLSENPLDSKSLPTMMRRMFSVVEYDYHDKDLDIKVPRMIDGDMIFQHIIKLTSNCTKDEILQRIAIAKEDREYDGNFDDAAIIGAVFDVIKNNINLDENSNPVDRTNALYNQVVRVFHKMQVDNLTAKIVTYDGFEPGMTSDGIEINTPVVKISDMGIEESHSKYDVQSKIDNLIRSLRETNTKVFSNEEKKQEYLNAVTIVQNISKGISASSESSPVLSTDDSKFNRNIDSLHKNLKIIGFDIPKSLVRFSFLAIDEKQNKFSHIKSDNYKYYSAYRTMANSSQYLTKDFFNNLAKFANDLRVSVETNASITSIKGQKLDIFNTDNKNYAQFYGLLRKGLLYAAKVDPKYLPSVIKNSDNNPVYSFVNYTPGALIIQSINKYGILDGLLKANGTQDTRYAVEYLKDWFKDNSFIRTALFDIKADFNEKKIEQILQFRTFFNNLTLSVNSGLEYVKGGRRTEGGTFKKLDGTDLFIYEMIQFANRNTISEVHEIDINGNKVTKNTDVISFNRTQSQLAESQTSFLISAKYIDFREKNVTTNKVETFIFDALEQEFNRIRREWLKKEERLERYNAGDNSLLNNYNAVLDKDGNIIVDDTNLKNKLRAYKFNKFQNLFESNPELEQELINLAKDPTKTSRSFSDLKLKEGKNTELAMKLNSLIENFIKREFADFKKVLSENDMLKISTTGDEVYSNIPQKINTSYIENVKKRKDRPASSPISVEYKREKSQSKFTSESEHFLYDFYWNYYVNSLFVNQLFDGDRALGIKSLMDLFKRNKGFVSAGTTLNGFYNAAVVKDIFVILDKENFLEGQYDIDDEKFGLDKSKKEKIWDGQAISTLMHRIDGMIDRGLVPNQTILNILIDANFRTLTKEEITLLEDNNIVLNSLKTVHSDSQSYLKLSEHWFNRNDISVLLSKHRIVDIIDEEGNIIGKDRTNYDLALADIRESYVRIFETRQKLKFKSEYDEGYYDDITTIRNEYRNIHSYYKALPNKEKQHEILNSMEFHNLDILMDTNSSKKVTLLPDDINVKMPGDIDENEKQYIDLRKSTIRLDANFKFHQVETSHISNEQKISIQSKLGITTDITRSILEDANNIEPGNKQEFLKVTDALVKGLKDYSENLKNVTNTKLAHVVKALRDTNGNMEIAQVLGLIREQLVEQKADSNIVQYFDVIDGKPRFDINMPSINKIFQYYFFSYYSNNIFDERGAGMKYVHASGYGHKLLIDNQTGDIITTEQIKLNPEQYEDTDRYSLRYPKITTEIDNDGNTTYWVEAIVSLPFFDSEQHKQLYMDKLRKEFATRIPNEGKRSGVAYKIVDFIDSSYRNTIILPQSIHILAGSDYDIDALYAQLYSVYKDMTGKYHKYGDKETYDNPKLIGNQKLIDFVEFINSVGQDKIYRTEIRNKVRELSNRVHESNDISIIVDSNVDKLLDIYNIPNGEIFINYYNALKKEKEAFDEYVKVAEKNEELKYNKEGELPNYKRQGYLNEIWRELKEKADYYKEWLAQSNLEKNEHEEFIDLDSFTDDLLYLEANYANFGFYYNSRNNEEVYDRTEEYYADPNIAEKFATFIKENPSVKENHPELIYSNGVISNDITDDEIKDIIAEYIIIPQLSNESYSDLQDSRKEYEEIKKLKKEQIKRKFNNYLKNYIYYKAVIDTIGSKGLPVSFKSYKKNPISAIKTIQNNKLDATLKIQSNEYTFDNLYKTRVSSVEVYKNMVENIFGTSPEKLVAKHEPDSISAVIMVNRLAASGKLGIAISASMAKTIGLAESEGLELHNQEQIWYLTEPVMNNDVIVGYNNRKFTKFGGTNTINALERIGNVVGMHADQLKEMLAPVLLINEVNLNIMLAMQAFELDTNMTVFINMLPEVQNAVKRVQKESTFLSSEIVKQYNQLERKEGVGEMLKEAGILKSNGDIDHNLVHFNYTVPTKVSYDRVINKEITPEELGFNIQLIKGNTLIPLPVEVQKLVILDLYERQAKQMFKFFHLGRLINLLKRMNPSMTGLDRVYKAIDILKNDQGMFNNSSKLFTDDKVWKYLAESVKDMYKQAKGLFLFRNDSFKGLIQLYESNFTDLEEPTNIIIGNLAMVKMRNNALLPGKNKREQIEKDIFNEMLRPEWWFGDVSNSNKFDNIEQVIEYLQQAHPDNPFVNYLMTRSYEENLFKNNEETIDGKVIPARKIKIVVSSTKAKLHSELKEPLIDGFNMLAHSGDMKTYFASKYLAYHEMIRNGLGKKSGNFVSYITPEYFEEQSNAIKELTLAANDFEKFKEFCGNSTPEQVLLNLFIKLYTAVAVSKNAKVKLIEHIWGMNKSNKEYISDIFVDIKHKPNVKHGKININELISNKYYDNQDTELYKTDIVAYKDKYANQNYIKINAEIDASDNEAKSLAIDKILMTMGVLPDKFREKKDKKYMFPGIVRIPTEKGIRFFALNSIKMEPGTFYKPVVHIIMDNIGNKVISDVINPLAGLGGVYKEVNINDMNHISINGFTSKEVSAFANYANKPIEITEKTPEITEKEVILQSMRESLAAAGHTEEQIQVILGQEINKIC